MTLIDFSENFEVLLTMSFISDSERTPSLCSKQSSNAVQSVFLSRAGMLARM